MGKLVIASGASLPDGFRIGTENLVVVDSQYYDPRSNPSAQPVRAALGSVLADGSGSTEPSLAMDEVPDSGTQEV